jgi:2-keto-4-pentenoate hydratase/2-oxohepta-3-ene-1,7-dioic acid hydratase in catechol pathway
MKITRFISTKDELHYGVIETLGDQTARLIKGNIYGEFTVSDETVSIKKIVAPVTPPNIIGIGLNYAKHAEETGIEYPDMPVMFLKGTNTITAPGDPIMIPKIALDEVDYEGELAVVIGKAAKNVPEEKVFDYILGYCCANDVSAREWQKTRQKKQWARGKSFDSFCPIGPWIVTKDEIPNPNKLRIHTEINGITFQDSNTSDMIFHVPALISHVSQSMTLLPGTVLLTGTPAGVGFTRTPPVLLKKGDTVTITIENIGQLSNPVILEE